MSSAEEKLLPISGQSPLGETGKGRKGWDGYLLHQIDYMMFKNVMPPSVATFERYMNIRHVDKAGNNNEYLMEPVAI
jgi:hypothetical protein